MQKANTNHLIITKDAPDSAKWYILHTQSSRENLTARAIKTRVKALGHDEYVFETFIPTQEKIRISKGKKTTIRERLFPGYLMIKMIVTDASWLAIRTAPGVTGFVGIDNKPTPLPKTEVQAVMAFSKQQAPKFQANFSVGEAIKIVDGPFTDLLGTVNTIDEAKGKVEILVSIFGRETPVELDFLQVSKI
ncbi:transcription termination/antitermination protein NusG [Patescibacteria group bacterium]|nr:transcription termination/antitermination protein NusG [Patescibacteria group bacterium]MBU1256294.1 transcription termination/antitermination protein NusG [Patescibacteria group bacterium]MBU1457530.1 transcription termination/antitermination protein NusG [Patescibacteria group bacterium]